MFGTVLHKPGHKHDCTCEHCDTYFNWGQGMWWTLQRDKPGIPPVGEEDGVPPTTGYWRDRSKLIPGNIPENLIYAHGPPPSPIKDDASSHKHKKHKSRSVQECSACNQPGHNKDTCSYTEIDQKIDVLCANGFTSQVQFDVKGAAQPEGTLGLRTFVTDLVINTQSSAMLLKALYRNIPAESRVEFFTAVRSWCSAVELNQQTKEAELASKTAQLEAERLKFEMEQRIKVADAQRKSGTGGWFGFGKRKWGE